MTRSVITLTALDSERVEIFRARTEVLTHAEPCTRVQGSLLTSQRTKLWHFGPSQCEVCRGHFRPVSANKLSQFKQTKSDRPVVRVIHRRVTYSLSGLFGTGTISARGGLPMTCPSGAEALHLWGSASEVQPQSRREGRGDCSLEPLRCPRRVPRSRMFSPSHTRDGVARPKMLQTVRDPEPTSCGRSSTRKFRPHRRSGVSPSGTRSLVWFGDHNRRKIKRDGPGYQISGKTRGWARGLGGWVHWPPWALDVRRRLMQPLPWCPAV